MASLFVFVNYWEYHYNDIEKFMKNALIVLGLILAFAAGYFLSQKYNFKVETKSVTPPATTTITPSPEEENLEVIIKQLLVEKYGSSANDMTVTVSQRKGNYARGGVTEPGGGGLWLAVRNAGNWQLVFDGNGVPDCTMLKTTYSFPQDLLVGVCD